MKRLRTFISFFGITLLAGGLILSTLQLHEISAGAPDDPDGQIVESHFFCPVCHALFEFSFDNDTTSSFIDLSSNEIVRIGCPPVFARQVPHRDGRAPPSVV